MEFNLKGNYYNNQFHQAPQTGPYATEVTINRYCPADLDNQLWSCKVNYNDVDPAIDSAIQGFKVWKKLSTQERTSYLLKFQEQVKLNKDLMAQAISMETGKPLWEAHTEVGTIINKVTVTTQESLQRISTQHIPEIMPKTDGYVYFRPLGPCLIIGPFNFPCHLANGQIVNALMAGNSIIFKPSEKTCYSGQVLIECFHQAGFPKGVINLVQGDGEIGRRLIKNKSIKGIYFTGSKDVGKKILEATHQDLSKLVCVELGGKNVSIVNEDAPIDMALPELLKACFLTTGQRCVSTSIILIHKKLQNEFLEKFHSLAKRIVIDHPIKFEKEPFMGPLVDQSSLEKYLLFMGMAKREGVEEIMRGKQIEKRFRGHYVSPSIHFSPNYKTSSVFLTNEIFGPNATFIPFDHIEEAITIANSSEYGLASCVFSKDRSIYQKCVDDIECGVVNFNRSTVGSSARLPFGGVKNSGNYRPMAAAAIDACVYPLASLENRDLNEDIMSTIKGLE